MDEDSSKKLGKVIKIDEAEVQKHVEEIVRGTVEETLNARNRPVNPLSRPAVRAAMNYVCGIAMLRSRRSGAQFSATEEASSLALAS